VIAQASGPRFFGFCPKREPVDRVADKKRRSALDLWPS
jgi:hypothetical protein